MSADPAAEMKQGQAKMWGEVGDYASIATYITDVSDKLVNAIDVRPGMTLLDVGTGTGNAAIPAAKAGAQVTGLDLAPGLIEEAKRHGEKAGVEVEWVVGDAESLPFDDASFDAVISVVGHMFAPRHRETADELLRVTKPGGTIGFACWTPRGSGGDMFKTVGSFMPPPPDFASPPALWGTEDHVREMIGDGVEDLKMELDTVTIADDRKTGWLGVMEEAFPPIVAAKGVLGPEKFGEMREALGKVFAEHNQAEDGSTLLEQEYLRTTAKRKE